MALPQLWGKRHNLKGVIKFGVGPFWRGRTREESICMAFLSGGWVFKRTAGPGWCVRTGRPPQLRRRREEVFVMGQAFDESGHVLSEAFGRTKREVFDKLIEQSPDAHELRIRTLKEVIEDANTAQREMPRYKSHKTVHALKIAEIVRDGEGENRDADGSAIIMPADEGYGPFRVESAYMRKHDPQVGGYFVVYDDGYRSFSPAEAFEEGYTRIE